jgi:hypothetical protein
MHPAFADVGICDAGIKRVITHFDRLSFNGRITKRIGPVENVVQLDSPTRANFGRSLGSRGKSPDQELVIIGYLSLGSLSAGGEAGIICFPGVLSKSWVLDGVIDLVQIFAEAIMKRGQRPDGLPLGIN